MDDHDTCGGAGCARENNVSDAQSAQPHAITAEFIASDYIRSWKKTYGPKKTHMDCRHMGKRHTNCQKKNINLQKKNIWIIEKKYESPKRHMDHRKKHMDRRIKHMNFRKKLIYFPSEASADCCVKCCSTIAIEFQAN